MRGTRILICSSFALVLGAAGCLEPRAAETTAGPEVRTGRLRVGTFDSRGVALA